MYLLYISDIVVKVNGPFAAGAVPGFILFSQNSNTLVNSRQACSSQFLSFSFSSQFLSSSTKIKTNTETEMLSF